MHHRYYKRIPKAKLRNDRILKVIKTPDNLFINERLHDTRGRPIQICFSYSKRYTFPVGTITVSMNKCCKEIRLVYQYGGCIMRVPKEFAKLNHLDYESFKNHLALFLKVISINHIS